jgi:predicted nucleic acid-binding protein
MRTGRGDGILAFCRKDLLQGSRVLTTVKEPTSIRVAFDTCTLIDWYRKPPEKSTGLSALAQIFEVKRTSGNNRWYFIYLDAVRREYGGQLFDRLSEEARIQDILPCFDKTVCRAKVPMIVPFTVFGKEHGEIESAFRAMSVSKADSTVLADAVYLKAQFLVTTDMRLIRNEHAVRQAQSRYELTIVSPTNFLAVA